MATRIVVIDHDPFMRKVFSICLGDAAYNVLSYDYEGIDLSFLQQLHPDLIILNINQKDGGDGWQFLQLLRMDDTTAHLPVLISTTVFPLAAEMRSYLLAQYIHIIYQPFDLATLLRLVRHTLSQADQAGGLISGNRTLPILLVEDTEQLREGVETILMLEGYRVSTAGNGLLALDAVYHAEYCLIFLDIRMPIMDGFEFLRIYDRQRRPHAPVIIFSAESDIQTRVLPSFVVAVLPKPFHVNQLVSLAEKYIRAV